MTLKWLLIVGGILVTGAVLIIIGIYNSIGTDNQGAATMKKRHPPQKQRG